MTDPKLAPTTVNATVSSSVEDLLDEGLVGDHIIEVRVQLSTHRGTEIADESLARVESGQDGDDAD